MRANHLLLLFVLISFVVSSAAMAQNADRRTRQRGAKFGAKPGEVITPPDRASGGPMSCAWERPRRSSRYLWPTGRRK